MSFEDKTLKLCDCNRSMRLDGAAIGRALGAERPIPVHSQLCRKQIGEFESAARGGECVVACTQEAALFTEVAAGSGGKAVLKFVNIRETGGWSAEREAATPKIAALLALAELPDPEPLPSVSYRSGGQLLVIGPAEAAVQWAERLAGDLEVAALLTSTRGAELPVERAFPVWSGRVSAIEGWLGEFAVTWEQENPIDLDACTRCNACIHACPEQAIDFTFQIDPDRCKAHRACVAACGSIRAIDFDRADRARSERFDLVLDLSPDPVLKVPRKPQGYLAPGRDPLEQALAAAELARLVGEFEKPKFFVYNERLCAHSRSGKIGCSACIDTCSTRAIAPDGDKVRVEPHLCLGCGACATVCPSGAMTYANPRAADMGARLKKVLAVYAAAGGRDAGIVFHNGRLGREVIARIARRGRGLPARMIPLEIFHPASIGIDALLGAVAYGASQVVLLADEHEHTEYVAALERQIRYAQAMLDGLGYGGRHFHLVYAEGAAAVERLLWSLEPAVAPAKPAAFNLANEKRTTLDFVIDHLAKHALQPQSEIPLPAGAPFGRVEVNRQTCTLCMACVGACPVSALVDGRERPMLRFIERNCVQCGLCVSTCPEKAVALVPRLLLAPAARQEVVLNEAEPFDCVRCGKPFATRQMIENMLGKLGTHSMFAGAGALRRLQMCADCRVVDMMENKHEASIFDVKP